MSFGKRLQELRKAAGLSQSQLAARAGVPIDSLRNWEQDKALPKIDTAALLAVALGVSLDRLAGAPKQPPAKAPGRKRKGESR